MSDINYKDSILTEDFIEQNFDELDLDQLCQHQELSREIIETHIDRFSDANWKQICKYQALDESFIRANPSKIDFDLLHQNPNLMISDSKLAYLEKDLSKSASKSAKSGFDMPSSQHVGKLLANYLDWSGLSKSEGIRHIFETVSLSRIYLNQKQAATQR